MYGFMPRYRLRALRPCLVPCPVPCPCPVPYPRCEVPKVPKCEVPKEPPFVHGLG